LTSGPHHHAEIVAAAWQLAREVGVAGLTLKELARRVGMQAPSLYQYFPSKHAIYDAMFADGYRQLTSHLQAVAARSDPREALRQVGHAFLQFAVDDQARYQLLFTRAVPGFEPSPESYAVSIESLEQARQRLVAAGLTQPRQLDLWTALLSGLASQQLANDPGGDRWTRLADEAIDMYLRTYTRTRRRSP
jgi:AcrR family transcriptional regulator